MTGRRKFSRPFSLTDVEPGSGLESVAQNPILEIGCGTGILTRLLCQAFRQPSVLASMWPEMVAQAKRSFGTSQCSGRGGCGQLQVAEFVLSIVSSSSIALDVALDRHWSNGGVCCEWRGISSWRLMVDGTLSELVKRGTGPARKLHWPLPSVAEIERPEKRRTLMR